MRDYQGELEELRQRIARRRIETLQGHLEIDLGQTEQQLTALQKERDELVRQA